MQKDTTSSPNSGNTFVSGIPQRTIKFRGQRVDNGEWVYVCLVNNLWLYNIDGVSKFGIANGTKVCEIITGDYDGDCWEDIIDEEKTIVTVIPKSVSQFVGLMDILTKDAYEGDIIERDASDGKGKVRGLIVFEQWQFRVNWFDKNKGWNNSLYLHLEDSKIIGNFCQNHELLG